MRSRAAYFCLRAEPRTPGNVSKDGWSIVKRTGVAIAGKHASVRRKVVVDPSIDRIRVLASAAARQDCVLVVRAIVEVWIAAAGLAGAIELDDIADITLLVEDRAADEGFELVIGLVEQLRAA